MYKHFGEKTMRLNIKKWGNSAGICLPTLMLSQLGAKIGDAFEVKVSKKTVTFRLAKPRYKLADLLAECDTTAEPPNLNAWDKSDPIGQEVW